MSESWSTVARTPAGEVTAAEDAAAEAGTRAPRRRARSSILAHGEPMLWLTGGGLAIACLMIIGLLGLVCYYGLSTFWPGSIQRVTTLDGRVFMGEVFRSDTYRPQELAFRDLPPEVERTFRERVAANGGESVRRLYRTGNFRLTQRHFHWVDDNLVETEDAPEWAVMLERMEWGRFYGFPVALARIEVEAPPASREDVLRRAKELAAQQGEEDVRLLATVRVHGREQETLLTLEEAEQAVRILGITRCVVGPEQAWKAFQAHHGEARENWRMRRRLEKKEIGEANLLQEKARQRLKLALIRKEEAERAGGEDSAGYRAAHASYAEAKREFDEVTRWAGERFAEVRETIGALNRESGRFRLFLETAGEDDTPPQTALLRLDDIVRGYPANQLSGMDKFGVYFSRWWEFLSDEPREANSEGGVYPAIFGTVIMTFIMIIIVVPFGVLASLYLKEYAKAGLVVSAVRIAVNNLAGVPSIVFGVFGLGFFCYGVGSFIDAGPSAKWSASAWWTTLVLWIAALAAGTALWSLGLSRVNYQAPRPLRLFKGMYVTLFVGAALAVGFALASHVPFFDGFYQARLPNPTFGKGGLLWASLTLALLTLPVVIVATEEALAAVPNSMREGSYACGASKWQTIKRIVLPRAMPGIMTGTVLAMARGAGEVAPLMLVGAVKLAPELPVDGTFPFFHPERSFMHLGFHIYDVGFQSQNSEAAKPMVYTTTMLLIVLVVLMNLLATYLRNRLRKRFVVQAF